MFTSANAMNTLLTMESLLFAVFALSMSFGSSAAMRTMTARSARRLAIAAAATLTVLGAGAAVAWCDLFLRDWPDSFGRSFPVVAIAGGIVAQPVFAWMFVAKLART